MKIIPNTITLTTLDGEQSVILAFMMAFKGDPGAEGDPGTDGEDGDDAEAGNVPIPMIPWTSAERYATQASDEFGLILGNRATAQTLKIAEISDDPEVTEKFVTGSYFSMCQKGAGRISIVEDEGVILTTPGGYLPSTRAQGSTISLTCTNAATNEWLASGDLTIDPGE